VPAADSRGWAAAAKLTAGATRAKGLWADGGHRWRNSRRSLAKSRQPSLSRPASKGAVDGFASRIVRKQTQQRLPRLRQVAARSELTAGKIGWLSSTIPTKNGCPPCRRLGAAARHGRLARQAPTSRRRSGVGVVGTAGAGAHHSHSQPQTPLQQPCQGRVPRRCRRSARAASLLRIKAGINGAVQAGLFPVQQQRASAGSCTQDGDR